MMKKVLLFLTPLILMGKPVKIDEILTEQNKIRLDTSISYSNINRKAGLSAPIIYETANGDFVNIPTYIGNASTNQDYINYGFNFKYGISEKLEIFTNINLFTSDTHISSSQFENSSNTGFSNLNVGLIYQIKNEDETPSLLVGGSTDLVESVTFSNEHKENLNFTSYSFFATSYYTVDPLVFLLTARYRLNLEKKYENENIEMGNIFTLSPNIYFAVNPYTSISWGVRYQFKDKDRINGEVVSNSGSSISYLFGTSYEISSKYILNFNAEKKDTNYYCLGSVCLRIVSR